MGEGWFKLFPIPADRWGNKRDLSQLCRLGQLPRQPTPLSAETCDLCPSPEEVYVFFNCISTLAPFCPALSTVLGPE